MPPDGRIIILDDTQLANATRDELRVHYTALAAEYHRNVGIEAPAPAVDVGKAFAATVNNYVLVVEAAESNEGQLLFEPLSDDELKTVSGWSLGELDQHDDVEVEQPVDARAPAAG